MSFCLGLAMLFLARVRMGWVFSGTGKIVGCGWSWTFVKEEDRVLVSVCVWGDVFEVGFGIG